MDINSSHKGLLNKLAQKMIINPVPKTLANSLMQYMNLGRTNTAPMGATVEKAKITNTTINPIGRAIMLGSAIDSQNEIINRKVTAPAQ